MAITVLVYHSFVYASDSLCIHSSHTILTPWRQVSPCRMRHSLYSSPTLRLFDDSDHESAPRPRDSGADAVLSLPVALLGWAGQLGGARLRTQNRAREGRPCAACGRGGWARGGRAGRGDLPRLNPKSLRMAAPSRSSPSQCASAGRAAATSDQMPSRQTSPSWQGAPGSATGASETAADSKILP